jgi:hypothetical protein
MSISSSCGSLLWQQMKQSGPNAMQHELVFVCVFQVWKTARE